MTPKLKRRTLVAKRNGTKDLPNSLSTINLETLLKLPVGIAGLFYIVGIFVQGFYYGRLQINSLSLFKLSYIMAGFWACFYLFFPSIIIIFALSFIFYKRIYLLHQRITRLKLGIYLICGLVLILISCSLYYLISYQTVFFPSPEDFDISIAADGRFDLIPETFGIYKQYIPLSLVFTVFNLIALSIFITAHRYVKSLSGKGLVTVIIVSIYISFSMLTINEFSRLVYGHIPTFIGGGQLRPVYAFIKTNKRSALNMKDFLDNNSIESIKSCEQHDALNEENCTQESVFDMKGYLVLESDGEYYFKSFSEGNIVRIPRDKIINVKHISTSLAVFDLKK